MANYRNINNKGASELAQQFPFKIGKHKITQPQIFATLHAKHLHFIVYKNILTSLDCHAGTRNWRNELLSKISDCKYEFKPNINNLSTVVLSYTYGGDTWIRRDADAPYTCSDSFHQMSNTQLFHYLNEVRLICLKWKI